MALAGPRSVGLRARGYGGVIRVRTGGSPWVTVDCRRGRGTVNPHTRPERAQQIGDGTRQDASATAGQTHPPTYDIGRDFPVLLDGREIAVQNCHSGPNGRQPMGYYKEQREIEISNDFQ
jgi:hypothetical protein